MVENLSGQQVAADKSLPASTATFWWLYLLACADGRTYAGIAIDLEARFRLHKAGKGAKFTRANPPLKILGAKLFTDKGAALRAEYALKQLNKADKLLWAKRRESHCAQIQFTETKYNERRTPKRQARQSRQET
jgi:putative endonuclease